MTPTDADTGDVRTFDVDPDHRGERLDRFLASRMDDRTRSAIRKLIEAGRVWIDGDVAPKAGVALEPGMEVEVDVPAPEPLELVPEAMSLAILHEDDAIVVLDKPPGRVVHPGAGHRRGTLVHGLLGRGVALSSVGAPDRPGIVHRLDRDTSGVLVVAKTDAAHHALAESFASRTVDKTYHALVWGRPDPPEATIERAIGRHPKDRTRMAVGVAGGRRATTHYRTVQAPPGFAWLEVRIETGRTHQIRVHLEAIGHPVVGDAAYGGPRWRGVRDPVLRKTLREFPRQALHASALAFDHPVTGRRVRFVSPIPDDVRALLEAVGGGAP